MEDMASQNPAQPRTANTIPVWERVPGSPREKFKVKQREWRMREAERRLETLQSGDKQYRVELCEIREADGSMTGRVFKVLALGKPVDHLTVGASTAEEARSKFAEYNGISGVPKCIRATVVA
jgi:hypothetical protein